MASTADTVDGVLAFIDYYQVPQLKVESTKVVLVVCCQAVSTCIMKWQRNADH